MEIKPVMSVAGQRIQLSVTTDNIPACALLTDWEAQMVAGALIKEAGRVHG